MKRFKFTLRSVSILRTHKEMRAREALAGAIGALAEAQGRLESVQAGLAEMAAIKSASRLGRFRADEEVNFFRAYVLESAKERESRKQVAAAAAEAETRRNACMEANRELKAVERLEAKQIEQHRAEVFRAEQAEFDEMSGRRAACKEPLFT